MSYRNGHDPLEANRRGGTARSRRHVAASAGRSTILLLRDQRAVSHRLFPWKRSEAVTATNPSSAIFPRAQSSEPGAGPFTEPVTRGSRGDGWQEPCPLSGKCSFDSTPRPAALCQLRGRWGNSKFTLNRC